MEILKITAENRAQYENTEEEQQICAEVREGIVAYGKVVKQEEK